MRLLRILYACIVRSRCPCCKEGALFAGPVAFREVCPACGLRYEQWVGDWITPTYLAGTVGIAAALVAVGVLWWAGALDGPVSPTLPVLVVACAAALVALRPCKAAWLGFMYWVGGVEVSAETLAHLRWSGAAARAGGAAADLADAEERARSVGRHEPAEPELVVRRFTSLREVLLPRPYRVARPDPQQPATPGRSPSPRRPPREPVRR